MRFRAACFATVALVFAACSVVNAPDDPKAVDDEGGSGSPNCGDGVVDTQLGETCDPPSSCPSCDDGDPCTEDGETGSADTCDVACTHTAITSCETAGDGCCPASCDGTLDFDCSTCGNGTIEVGEICDGACPTASDCDDADACTIDALTGSAETCDAECSNTAITTCTGGDGCCAQGCTVQNDPDCAIDVALVHAVQAIYAQDVQSKLAAFDVFNTVDIIDAGLGVPPPTLAQLTPYDALLVFSDGSFTDPVGLGNVLADYFDAGGRVVTATFARCDGSVALQGRFATPSEGYILLASGSQAQPGDNLGQVFEPSSPLMTDVFALSSPSAFRCTGSVINGGIVVAQWAATPQPLVVRGVVQGRNRVDLNFYPPSAAVNSSFWIGDGAALMRNALLFE